MCRKFINNGRHNGGCREKECENYHPKICNSSYKNRTCSSEGKCTDGFHLKGTKFVTTQVVQQTDNVVVTTPVTQNSVAQNTVTTPVTTSVTQNSGAQNTVTQNQDTVTVTHSSAMQSPVTQNIVTQCQNIQIPVIQNVVSQS